MTFRKLLLLGGIGGLIYAHRKRGGQMTVESFKQSGHDLLDGIKSRVSDLRSQAESRLDDVVGKAHDTSESFSSSKDVTGYGSSGYGYGGGSTIR
jgi:hypothetical protein